MEPAFSANANASFSANASVSAAAASSSDQGAGAFAASPPTIYVAEMLRTYRNILLIATQNSSATHSIFIDSEPPNRSSLAVESAPGIDLGEPLALSARLPSRPEHRVAAASALLTLVFLRCAMLLIRGTVWRPAVLQRRATAMGTNKEWSPIRADVEEGGAGGVAPSAAVGDSSSQSCCSRAACDLPSSLQSPVAPQRSYNTFADGRLPLDEDAAWMAAKQDWHRAINAARAMRGTETSLPR